MAHSSELLGLPAQAFLDRVWQKALAWGRQSLAPPEIDITTELLIELVASDEVDSRLILGPDSAGQWEAHQGPFARETFSKLPARGWTLLVQDLDKWLPEVGKLWSQFAAIPPWRRDDIMVSWAAPGGSVGPHVDRYDVFLAQLSGQREWTTGRPGTTVDPHLTDGLKLCSIEQAERHAIANPRDVLYLPPGVAHHGVAVNECLTLSFGMRAPSVGEIVLEFAQDLASRDAAEAMYRDPDLRVHTGGFWVAEDTTHHLRDLLSAAVSMDRLEFDRWAARLLTSFSARREAPEPERVEPELAIRTALRAGRRAQFSPWSRRLGIRNASQPSLAIDGETYEASAELVNALLAAGPFQWTEAFQDTELELLVALIQTGQMIWLDHA